MTVNLQFLGLSVFLAPLLTKIPMACLYGVFLYMGFSSLKGVQFFDRIKLLFIPKKYHPGKNFISRDYNVLKICFLKIIFICDMCPS